MGSGRCVPLGPWGRVQPEEGQSGLGVGTGARAASSTGSTDICHPWHYLLWQFLSWSVYSEGSQGVPDGR